MMNIKKLISASMVAVALSGCQREAVKPNVLFILVDDMQADAIAALGSRDTYTPNIDRLINEGMAFTRTYTNGALCGALSMPSRAMLLTGRGVFEVQSDGMKIPASQITLPEHLKNNGYRTFATGKWHSDHASFARSFTEGDNIFFGGMHPYEENGHCAPRLHHFDPTGKYDEPPFVGQNFSSKMYADAAINFLKTTEHNNQPFMAFVSFTSPHDPRNILPDYGKKYCPAELSVPDNFLPEHPFDNGELNIRDEQLLPVPRTPEQLKKELSLYYGMVSEVDLQIGRVVDALEESGNMDNTIIVFASDNGLAMGQNGLIGKQSLYEHSVGVPMAIITPDGLSSGKRSDALCYLYDLYPTLCDLMGLDVPVSVTGKSLKPVMEGKQEQIREQVFLAYSNQQRAVVSGDYKYIIYNVEGKITEQLFNLQKDPGELVNLADELTEKKNELHDLLMNQMVENHDFCDLTQPLWWKDGHKLTWDELINLYVFE